MNPVRFADRNAAIVSERDAGIPASVVAKAMGIKEGAVNSIYARALDARRLAEEAARSQLLNRWRRHASA